MSDLLIGNGYLGRAIGRNGVISDLVAVKRSAADRTTEQAGVLRVFADILTAQGVASLAAARSADYRCVYFMLPPSAFGEHPPEQALAPLQHFLRQRRVQRVVLVSSTGVYADTAAASITLAATPQAQSPRVRRLLAIEQAWAATDFELVIVRLAGIYGPGRVIGRGSVIDRQPLPGDGEAWLNLIHVDDAARAIITAGRMEQPPSHLLLSDGAPCSRLDYYNTLAGLLGCPAPVFDGKRPRRGAAKKISADGSWQALGLAPEFVDCRVLLPQLIAEVDIHEASA